MELPEVLYLFVVADPEIARDANGRHLLDARDGWLDREEILEPGLREAFHHMWDCLQAERDLVTEEQLDSGDDEADH